MNLDERSSPLNRLTLPGGALLLAHLLLAIGGSALYICDYIPQLPAGRYPVFMFVIPVALGCFFLFVILGEHRGSGLKHQISGSTFAARVWDPEFLAADADRGQVPVQVRGDPRVRCYPE